MAQVWKIKLADGRVITPGDWTEAVPLWSTVEIAAGPFTVFRAFSYGRGGSVPGSIGPRQSDLTDTNLEGVGSKLPENEELICYQLGVSVFKQGLALSPLAFPDADNPGVPLVDMLRLQRDIIVKMSIANIKDYTNAPLSYWPPGMGVDHVYSGGRSQVSAAAPNGEVVAYNGFPAADRGRLLASALTVKGGESFYVEFSAGPGAVTGLNIQPDARYVLRTYLHGIRRRPVA